ncbi:MAG: rhodanese-like domain-containing protein [Fimbriiglobus sp.]|jgi:rhodanese-related sulfurtransferase|nr:rhodanese-like domain-containing protein [Fimbriiglobus sp.]
MPTISPTELKSLCEKGDLELIDVRTPLEFGEVHVNGAKNVPLDQLNPTALLWPNTDAGRPIYVVCRSGTRGQKACEKLAAAGFTNVINVEGGTLACEQAGVPVVRGKKAMSLERQVRIAAGGIALFGTVLALTVHPWFAGIPAVFGAGLVCAGLSNWCGLGMLIARMPWNRRVAV